MPMVETVTRMKYNSSALNSCDWSEKMAIHVRAPATTPFTMGFDLGGTKMMAAVVDSKWNITHSRREKHKSKTGQKLGVSHVIELVRATLEEAGLMKEQMRAFGIGCPGTIDLDKGVITEAPNLGWKNIPLKKELEQAFGCPVTIANDVDSGTFGEYRFGAGKAARCLIGVFPGTGIGGGCVYEGRLFRGKTGSALEIGHIQVQRDGPLCGCGRRGCIEAIASRLAIAKEAAVAAFRGNAPHLLAAAGTDLSQIRAKALAQSIAAGDAIIEKIVRRTARQLGRAIASVVNLMAPDTIVLGGGLVEAMPDLYLEEIRSTVKLEAMGAFTRNLKIAAAELGDNAGVLGAAALAGDAVKN